MNISKQSKCVIVCLVVHFTVHNTSLALQYVAILLYHATLVTHNVHKIKPDLLVSSVIIVVVAFTVLSPTWLFVVKVNMYSSDSFRPVMLRCCKEHREHYDHDMMYISVQCTTYHFCHSKDHHVVTRHAIILSIVDVV